jgi:hypothetical protein
MSKQESSLYRKAYMLFAALILIGFLSTNKIDITHFEDSSGIIFQNGNRVATYCMPAGLCSGIGIEFE